MRDLGSQLEAVLEHLRSEQLLAAQTTDKVAETGRDLASFLTRRGVESLDDLTPSDVRLFVTARNKTGSSTALATRYLRRTNLRLLLASARTLGLPVGDPTVDVKLPPRSLNATRPLTDQEVALCRLAARPRPMPVRMTAAFALAEATATTGEIPFIIVSDIVLDDRTVHLPGSRKTEQRTGRLTEWGVRALAGWCGQLSPDSRVVYGGNGQSLKGPQSSASQLIYKVLERAGLATEPDVRSGSVPAWAARAIFNETGSIASAARALGVRSLDTAARRIGWDWTEEGR